MSKKKATKFPADVKFAHLRIIGPDGTIYAGGGTTIAYRQTDAGTEYAQAKCHINDNYVKSLGRVKAAGRLNSTRFTKTFDGDEQAFLADVEEGLKKFNEFQLQIVRYEGLPDAAAPQMVRKYNGKRKGALTLGDALADLAGTPRPDNPTFVDAVVHH